MGRSVWDMDYQELRDFGKDNTPGFMDGFDPHNMTKKQHDHMLAQVYDGYKTRTVDNYEMRGAGDGRRNRKVGTKEVFSPGAYKDNAAWQKVAEAANISSINNKTDIAQMYRFIEDANKKDLDKSFAESNQPEAEAEPTPKAPVSLSERTLNALKTTSDYDANNLPNQGTQIFGNDDESSSSDKGSTIEQSFKDDYTLNLTENLKATDPVSLATKKAEIELADKNKVKMIFS